MNSVLEPVGDSNVAAQDPVEIVRTIYGPLLRSARRISASQQEAEDLVQEALVETLSHHPGFHGIARPLGYVRTVLYRQAFRRRRLRFEEIPLFLQERLEAPARSIDERLIAEHALSLLAPRQRACLVLRYLYGFDDRQIADTLGCGRSTVRSQISRALVNVRAHMGDEDA